MSPKKTIFHRVLLLSIGALLAVLPLSLGTASIASPGQGGSHAIRLLAQQEVAPEFFDEAAVPVHRDSSREKGRGRDPKLATRSQSDSKLRAKTHSEAARPVHPRSDGPATSQLRQPNKEMTK
jgi:hypothetical protein